ncbi:MAG: DUF7594 domain-containing protein [Chitinophagaceae bacterium]
MRKNKTTLVKGALLFAAGIASSVCASGQVVHYTQELLPAADAYVNSNTSGDGRNTNYGSSTELRFRYSQTSAGSIYNLISYLKFDLRSLALPHNAVIDSVSLTGTVFYSQSGSGHKWHLLPVTDNGWKEDSITWNNKPTPGADTISVVDKPSGTISSSSPYTAVWRGIKNTFTTAMASDSILSLALYTRLNTAANTSIYSREWSNAAQRPGLKIHYSVDTAQLVESKRRNLNVVYFLPTDVDTVPYFRQRLNGIMLKAQQFYRQWMSYYGYSNTTFGLNKDVSGMLKIVVINGLYPKANYPYDGGGSAMIPEINAYFAANPTEKTSTHTLVIMPATGSNPFYGLGNGWCFALDNPNIDTSYTGTSNYIGGLVHELGHGLNLPHDKEKVSEKSNPSLGTNLMGSGNTTYMKSATFMTQASCAILNNCEVFREDSITGLYNGGTASFSSFNSAYNSGNIVLSGKYTSNRTVNAIIAYNDQNDDGANYDQVAWVVNLVGSDSFNIEMPVAEFWKKYSTYTLRMRFLFTNGSSRDITYPYRFESNVPVININFNSADSATRPEGLYPVADTYIRNGSYGNTNYGGDSTLTIKPDPNSGYKREVFLKFRLSQFTGDISAVNALRLALKVKSANSSASNTLLAVRWTTKADWENTGTNSLTWNKWIADSSHIDSLTANYFFGGNWISWNINNDSLINRIQAGDSVVVFHITSSTTSSSVSTSDLSFYANESADTLDRPSLLLITGSSSEALAGNQEKATTAAQMREKQSVKVFPNPASGFVQVTPPLSGNAILFNATGNVVKRVRLIANINNRIELSGLPSGTYYLSMEGMDVIKIAVVK